jgi:hypothetical protein
MTIRIPSSLQFDLWTGALAVSGAYRVILLTNQYTHSPAHSRRSDLTASATLSHATDGTTGNHLLTLGGATIGTGPISCQWVAWVRWRGGAASADELVALLDMGRQITSDVPLVVPSQVIQTLRRGG